MRVLAVLALVLGLLSASRRKPKVEESEQDRVVARLQRMHSAKNVPAFGGITRRHTLDLHNQNLKRFVIQLIENDDIPYLDVFRAENNKTPGLGNFVSAVRRELEAAEQARRNELERQRQAELEVRRLQELQVQQAQEKERMVQEQRALEQERMARELQAREQERAAPIQEAKKQEGMSLEQQIDDQEKIAAEEKREQDKLAQEKSKNTIAQKNETPAKKQRNPRPTKAMQSPAVIESVRVPDSKLESLVKAINKSDVAAVEAILKRTDFVHYSDELNTMFRTVVERGSFEMKEVLIAVLEAKGAMGWLGLFSECPRSQIGVLKARALQTLDRMHRESNPGYVEEIYVDLGEFVVPEAVLAVDVLTYQICLYKAVEYTSEEEDDEMVMFQIGDQLYRVPTQADTVQVYAMLVHDGGPINVPAYLGDMQQWKQVVERRYHGIKGSLLVLNKETNELNISRIGNSADLAPMVLILRSGSLVFRGDEPTFLATLHPDDSIIFLPTTISSIIGSVRVIKLLGNLSLNSLGGPALFDALRDGIRELMNEAVEIFALHYNKNTAGQLIS